MLKINLLDKKAGASLGPFANIAESLGIADLSAEDWLILRGFALKAIVLVVGFMVAGYIPDYIQKKKLAELDQKVAVVDAELQGLEKELKTKQAVRAEMEKITIAETEIKGKLAVVSSLDNDRLLAFKVMDTVSLLIPDRVWIEGMTFTPKSLEITGSSWEFIPINDFVSLLKQSGVFDAVRLKSINTSPSSKIVSGVPLALQTIKKYEVSMDIKAGQVGRKEI